MIYHPNNISSDELAALKRAKPIQESSVKLPSSTPMNEEEFKAYHAKVLQRREQRLARARLTVKDNSVVLSPKEKSRAQYQKEWHEKNHPRKEIKVIMCCYDPCGIPFLPKDIRSKYCSPECAKAQQRENCNRSNKKAYENKKKLKQGK
jgi:hypothetical protein